MTFCNKCGARLEGDERFCVRCGSDLFAGETGGAPAARPLASTPGPAVQPAMATAGAYAAPGQIPAAMGMLQRAAKRGIKPWMVVAAAAIAVGAYYYHMRHQTPTPPEADSALAKEQSFAANWQQANGFIQITNGAWTNNDNTITVQSVTLECDQYSSSGSDLAHMQTTLNGPLSPTMTLNFGSFEAGAAAPNVKTVTCVIVHAQQIAASAL